MGKLVADLVDQHNIVLMANHGVVAYGTDLQSAYMKMETVEHFAQITLVTHLLGKQQPLDVSHLEKLLAVRSRYMGDVTSAARMPAFANNEPADDLVEEPVGEGKSFHSIRHRPGSGFRRGN